MKSLAALFTVFFFLYSCNNAEIERLAEKERSATNIALIEKYIDAVEAGDYPTIESMVADNYKGIGPSMDDSTNKTDGLASWKYNLENLYEKIEYLRSRNIAVTLTDGEYPGDWVSNWAVVSIKYKDGRGPVKVFANTLYKIEYGKISNTFTIYNENDVLEQLGMR